MADPQDRGVDRPDPSPTGLYRPDPSRSGGLYVPTLRWIRLRRRLWRMTYDVYEHFTLADGWAIASHIALTGLMSLFPFLIFVTSLAGFLGSSDLASNVVELIFEAWPKEVKGPIAGEITRVMTEPRGGLLTTSVILTIFFASSGVESLRIGLNRAYRVTETRPFWVTRIESIAFVIVGAVALLAFAFLIVLAPLMINYAALYSPIAIETAKAYNSLRILAATFILVATLLIVHLWLPAGSRNLRTIMPGILFTLAFWMAGGTIFGHYLAEFPANYVHTYAGLASGMVALVFLYTCSAIFLIGAEINAAVIATRRRRPRLGEG